MEDHSHGRPEQDRQRLLTNKTRRPMRTNNQTTDTTTGDQTRRKHNRATRSNIELLKLKQELWTRKEIARCRSGQTKASGDFPKLWEQERQQREELENRLQEKHSSLR